MAETQYKIVSADDHMDMTAIPPKLWEERLPAKWRDKAPRVVEMPEGRFWKINGELGSASGFLKNRVYPSAILRAGIKDDGYRPSNPKLRLQDMDMDGVYSQVIYGPPTGVKVPDPQLKAECLKVYNDWAMEFNSHDADRLCVLAYLPMHEPQAAMLEMRRAAKMGHKGAIASVFEAGVPIYEKAWELLWAASEETRIPVSFHLGGGISIIKPAPQSWQIEAFASVAPMQLDEALAIMVFNGALDKHPGMTLVLGEAGLGWIPYLVERMDMEFRNHGPSVKDIKISAKPSEIFARQVYATFEEDHVGVHLIPYIGVNNVMWASDYPHPDSTFPKSREAIRAVFKGSDAETVRKVTSENAARLYKVKGATGLS